MRGGRGKPLSRERGSQIRWNRTGPRRGEWGQSRASPPGLPGRVPREACLPPPLGACISQRRSCARLKTEVLESSSNIWPAPPTGPACWTATHPLLRPPRADSFGRVQRPLRDHLRPVQKRCWLCWLMAAGGHDWAAAPGFHATAWICWQQSCGGQQPA